MKIRDHGQPQAVEATELSGLAELASRSQDAERGRSVAPAVAVNLMHGILDEFVAPSRAAGHA
jgi:hypothetical protein